LNLASALLVVAVGLTVLRARRRHARVHRDGHYHHDHHGPHAYEGGLRSLVATGVSGGILPCPTALVVLLLIVAFSLGLAATVTTIGIVATSARSLFARRTFEGRIVQALPAASGVVVLVVGVAMAVRALPGVH